MGVLHQSSARARRPVAGSVESPGEQGGQPGGVSRAKELRHPRLERTGWIPLPVGHRALILA